MDGPDGGLAQWLRDRPDDELITLLGRRPEAAAASSFDELADRLCTPWSVRTALESADAAMLQLLEVLQALGDGVDPDLVERFLGRSPGPPLERLVALGLVWPGRDGRLRIAGPVADLTECPLGLGAPVAELLPGLSVDQLRTIAAGYGDRTARRKADWIELLTSVLTDPERIGTLLSELPAPVADLATRLAWDGPYLHGSITTLLWRASFEPREDDAPARLMRLGWVLPVGWDAGQMPLEVALAIRGPGYHPPLDAGPPVLAGAAVHAEHLTTGSRAAALSAVDGARRLVELAGRTPLATVRTGGVGTRELTRAAKALGAADVDVRLWLETLAAAGLVTVHRERLMPTPAADAWLVADPAEALVTLLTAWRTLDRLPMHHRDESGKAVPALAGVLPGANVLRDDLLRTLDDLGPARGFCDLDVLVDRLAWLRPGVYGRRAQAGPLVVAALAEGERLGLVAERALTPLGRALHAGDRDGLHAAAAALLPAPATTATFLPDLTALVSGAPAADLAELLDSAADQETRDAASTWRFSPTSVRRSLDAGRTADDLLAALTAVADRPLPQPLTYLVRDVARRHGSLRVSAAGCCLVADDPALAAEIANHRQLRGLALRRLAETVLASPEPAAIVLAALRDAGYAPVQQNATGATVIERPEPHRAPPQPAPRRPPVARPTLAGIVQRLRADPPQPPPAERSRIHTDVAVHADQLSPPEQRLLADAIERSNPILIQYVSAGGTHTTRVIEPEHLDTPLLMAWCHLRDAERHFLLSSITAVAPSS